VQAVVVPCDLDQRARSRKRLAAAAMVLALVDETGVDAERDVVEEDPVGDPPDVDPAFGAAAERSERREGIVAVEAEIAGEVVAGAERDTDERGVAIECDLRDRREGAVAAGYAEDLGARGPRCLAWILACREQMWLDSELPGGVHEFRGVLGALAGTRVDHQNGVGPHVCQVEPNGPWRVPRPMSIIPA
jgi:hypothetical protein